MSYDNALCYEVILMKKILVAMFSEDSSISMMRVMCFTALLIAGYLALKGQNDTVGVFVAAAFSGKAVQKYVELKNQSSP